jgi:hypothetical protein
MRCPKATTRAPSQPAYFPFFSAENRQRNLVRSQKRGDFRDFHAAPVQKRGGVVCGKSLVRESENARERFPRLKELSELALGNFLQDHEAIGAICDKYRASAHNGWTFPPLSEARSAWEDRYGPTTWECEMEDWGTERKLGTEGVEGSGG